MTMLVLCNKRCHVEIVSSFEVLWLVWLSSHTPVVVGFLTQLLGIEEREQGNLIVSHPSKVTLYQQKILPQTVLWWLEL
jgi:hypothetical protein